VVRQTRDVYQLMAYTRLT